MIGTPLYGSGDGSPTLPAAPPALPTPGNPVAPPSPFAVFNALFVELPMNFMQGLMAPFQATPKDDGMDSRTSRRFTPHGEVVQEMSTTDLKSKNIFGSGGSQ